jgi:xanthine dehydrogenase small subunit
MSPRTGADTSLSQTLRFVLDGRVVCIERPTTTMTLLDYLREVAGRRGTKEGCAEGDCGACTVVLGELSADRRRITYRAVNSCIRFLPTVDGKELVTVESLKQPSGALHPVQQSMIDHHASQCGFCTPGFVMSLLAMYLNESQASRDQVVEALAGNLCRCTGYRPIIDAGMHLGKYPAPQRWSREDAQSAERLATLQRLARDRDAGASLHYPGYHAPRTLDELSAALLAQPDSIVLAGGTDVGLWVTKQLRELPAMVFLGDVARLSAIEERHDELWIGAAVTFTDAWPALLRRFPELEEQAARFASPPIRNSATLCGNLANGSPIGDSIPALIALGAQIELRRGAAVRRLPLENFYLGYQHKDLSRGEFMTGVAIPARAQGRLLGSYKLAKRIDQDISAVCATFCVSIEGERVRSARLAYGGMAATACRARHAERALIAHGWTSAGIEASSAALAVDFKPLSDLRASSAYRLQAAGNLLRRFFLQSQRERLPRSEHTGSPSDGVAPRPVPQAAHMALRTDDASLVSDALAEGGIAG